MERFQKDRVEAHVARLDEEIAEHRADLASQREELAAIQKRLEAAPRWGQELAGMGREYETLRAKYASTVSRRADAHAAQALLGANHTLFHVLQPAVVPGKPSGPDRAKLLWMALAAALAAGLLATALVEWFDTSVRGPEDAGALGVPVLAAIPRIGPRRAGS
jgi:uncharacterized protein involved in exopolysaccharide biosynthesis